AIRILAGEGSSLHEMRDAARRIREALTPQFMQVIERARVVTSQMWSVLCGRPEGENIAPQATEIAVVLSSPDLFAQVARLDALAKVAEDRYRELYERRHDERASRFARAIDEIKGHPDWSQ